MAVVAEHAGEAPGPWTAVLELRERAGRGRRRRQWVKRVGHRGTSINALPLSPEPSLSGTLQETFILLHPPPPDADPCAIRGLRDGSPA